METKATIAPRRKTTAIRRQEIVDAAMRILATEGSRQFTTERVAAAVGITGGTIFRHFASMEEILDAVVDRIEEILFEGFPSIGDDPMDALSTFFAQRIRAIRAHPEISRLLMTDGLIPNSKSRPRAARLTALKQKSQRFVKECLTAAGQQGQLSPHVQPEDGALLVLGAIHAIGHMRMRPASAKQGEEQIRNVWKLLEETLRGRQQEAS